MQDTSSNYLERLNSIAILLQDANLTHTEICLLISLRLFPDRPACGVGIVGLSSDGVFHVVATFGIASVAQTTWAAGPIARNSPIVEAMRTSAVVCVSSHEEMLARYPDHDAGEALGNPSSVITVPIRRLGAAMGALVILDCDVEINQDCIHYLEVVAGLLALKFSIDPSFNETKIHASSHASRHDELTQREILVQSLMKLGKTNLQIGEALGYSESTIRQDAVSMFIKLGVHNRKDAGDLA